MSEDEKKFEALRKDFEAWASGAIGRVYRNCLPGSNHEGYEDVYTQLCWRAWQAAAGKYQPMMG